MIDIVANIRFAFVWLFSVVLSFLVLSLLVLILLGRVVLHPRVDAVFALELQRRSIEIVAHQRVLIVWLFSVVLAFLVTLVLPFFSHAFLLSALVSLAIGRGFQLNFSYTS